MIIAKILNYSKSERAASLYYGIEYQQYARKRYVKLMRKQTQ